MEDYAGNSSMRRTFKSVDRIRNVFAWLAGFSDGRPLAVSFVVLSLPILVFLAIMVPTGEAPDEATHLIRADSVRHGKVLGFAWWRLDSHGKRVADAAVSADPGLLAPGFAFPSGTKLADKIMTRHRVAELLRMSWANKLEPILVTNTAVYAPLLYVPAAAGLQLSKWFGSGPAIAIIVARLSNVVAYVALVTAAISLATRGRMLIFASCALPMSLALAASLNQDGLVIACCSLAAALLTRREERSWWFAIGWFALAALAKPYLLPMSILIVATAPKFKTRRWSKTLGGVLAGTLPAVVWTVAMAEYVAAPFVRDPAYTPGPLFSGAAGTTFSATNPAEQFRILVAEPSLFLTLPIKSLTNKGEWVWSEAIGVLGTLDVVFPLWFYDCWIWAIIACVLAALVQVSRANLVDTAALATCSIAACVASVWLGYILQYVSWTEVGQSLIEGFQGRYLIPIAALALPVFASGGRSRSIKMVAQTALEVPVILMVLMGGFIIPAVVLWSYYIR